MDCMTIFSRVSRLTARICLSLALCATGVRAAPVDFARDVQPLLASRCYQGRDFRLTDVHGSVVKDLLV